MLNVHLQVILLFLQSFHVVDDELKLSESNERRFMFSDFHSDLKHCALSFFFFHISMNVFNFLI